MVYWIDNGTGWRLPSDTLDKARYQAIELAREPDWASRKFGKMHFGVGESEYDNAVPIYASESGKTIVGYVVAIKRFNFKWVVKVGRGWKYHDIDEYTGKLLPTNRFKPIESTWDWTKYHYKLPTVYKRR